MGARCDEASASVSERRRGRGAISRSSPRAPAGARVTVSPKGETWAFQDAPQTQRPREARPHRPKSEAFWSSFCAYGAKTVSEGVARGYTSSRNPPKSEGFWRQIAPILAQFGPAKNRRFLADLCFPFSKKKGRPKIFDFWPKMPKKRNIARPKISDFWSCKSRQNQAKLAKSEGFGWDISIHPFRVKPSRAKRGLQRVPVGRERSNQTEGEPP